MQVNSELRIHIPALSVPALRTSWPDPAIAHERVLATYGPIEIRQLAPTLLVTTQVKGPAKQACLVALRRCADKLGLGRGGWRGILRCGTDADPSRISVVPVRDDLWRVSLQFDAHRITKWPTLPVNCAKLTARLLPERRVAAAAFRGEANMQAVARSGDDIRTALAALDYPTRGTASLHFAESFMGFGPLRPCEIELSLEYPL